MTNTECIERAKIFYELLLSDFSAIQADYLAEKFSWENPLPENIPFGGIYEGADGLLQYLGAINEAIEMSPMHFTDIVANDHVVSLIGIEENTLVRSTGRRYTMPFVHVIRFDADGRVSHVREYNDTREMVVAFG